MLENNLDTTLRQSIVTNMVKRKVMWRLISGDLTSFGENFRAKNVWSLRPSLSMLKRIESIKRNKFVVKLVVLVVVVFFSQEKLCSTILRLTLKKEKDIWWYFFNLNFFNRLHYYLTFWTRSLPPHSSIVTMNNKR